MGLWSRHRLGLIMHYQKKFQVYSINNDKLNFVWLGLGHNVFWWKAIHNVLILPKSMWSEMDQNISHCAHKKQIFL